MVSNLTSWKIRKEQVHKSRTAMDYCITTGQSNAASVPHNSSKTSVNMLMSFFLIHKTHVDYGSNSNKIWSTVSQSGRKFILNQKFCNWSMIPGGGWAVQFIDSWNRFSVPHPFPFNWDDHPSLSNHYPKPQCEFEEVCQPQRPHNVQSFQRLKTYLILFWHPAARKYFGNLCQGNGLTFPRVLWPCLLSGGCEKILRMFLPLCSAQVSTAWDGSVCHFEVVKWLPRLQLKVLHGLFEFFLLPNLCFCRRRRSSPSGRSISISCLRSPLRQPSPTGLHHKFH